MSSAVATEPGKFEGENPHWAFVPPSGSELLDHDVDCGEFDWDAVKDAIEERRGYPVVISGEDDTDKAEKKKEAKKDDAPAPAQPHSLFKGSTDTRYNYNR